ncbi:MAG: aminotransferase class V-fold PLP-dependent enzyme [Pseudomonadota bacterium]
MTDQIRKRMLAEMQQKDAFNTARDAAFEYADAAWERQVFPGETALKNLDHFDEPMPETPGNANDIVEQLHRYGSPATISQIAGRYFGLVNGGVIPAALAVRWLTDFWDQNTPLYVTSPIAARLEQIVESWLANLLGLPENTAAGFVSGSSIAIFAGLAAARYRLFEKQGWDINRQGFSGAPPIRVIASEQAHGTVTKAIALLGFGTDQVEKIPADTQGRIDASQVPELDASCLLILQAGNVNSGAFDDFSKLCEKARQADSWVHIDGAFGLWAATAEKMSHLTAGMELADSWSLDGHKTLNTPYDCGIVLCQDREALTNALHAAGSYIVFSENRDGMLLTPEMSRRARIVELWAALKYLGKSGTDDLVYGLHCRARQFAKGLAAQGFEILNDVVFNQVLVSCGDDSKTQKTITLIQQSGECWVGGAQWQGQSVIRVSVCSWATTEADIERSITAFVNARNSA